MINNSFSTGNKRMKYLYIDPANDSLTQSEDEPTVGDMMAADDGDIDILRISEDDGLIEKAVNISFTFPEDDDDEENPTSYECRWIEIDTSVINHDDSIKNPRHE